MKEEQLKASFLIKKIGESMGKYANKSLQSCALTHVQAHLLMALHCAGEDGLSLKELEKYFHVSQPTMVGTVSRLEKKELVLTFPDPRDRRSKRVRLTEAGIRHCIAAKAEMECMDTHLTSALSEEERTEFLRMLLIVYNTIKSD